jgi:DMSO/TMAO reductase YedYZ molybdopterin-dependent catalytic subunit
MTRRDLLFMPGACSLLRQALASSEPQNLSFPLADLTGTTTPADQFFVREHFAEPELLLKTWRLRVEGRVARPLELSLADLIESPTRKLEAIIECAGNAAGGSAVSNAVWEGVPISHLLREAGAAADAVSVLLEGADSGRLMPESPRAAYCQVASIAKCAQPESLVAFQLNDRFLPPRNGFPARALLPGWYAMDSVKWLTRLVVLGPNDEPSDFLSSGMNKVYNRIQETSPGKREVTRLTDILVKSAIAWPGDASKLPAARHTIRGFAWTGNGMVRSVVVSTDGGHSWNPAQFEAPPKAFSWVRWRSVWTAAPGDYVLMSRATDDAGRTQPLVRDPARKDGYELNYCPPVRCEVR